MARLPYTYLISNLVRLAHNNGILARSVLAADPRACLPVRVLGKPALCLVGRPLRLLRLVGRPLHLSGRQAPPCVRLVGRPLRLIGRPLRLVGKPLRLW